MKKKITHKKDARLRQTVCKISYGRVKNLSKFLKEQLRGHWRLVTCKTCIKQRKEYEQQLKNPLGKWIRNPKR